MTAALAPNAAAWPQDEWPADFPVSLLSVTPDPTLTAMLAPRPNGWIGSDLAKSIPIRPGNRVLWLFGDTLVGSVSEGRRQPCAAFINNSIAIQNSAMAPPAGIEFHWGPDVSSFFPPQPGTDGAYYWPVTGLQLGGELFLWCYSVSGFIELGKSTLIRIHNPDSPPPDWMTTVSNFGVGDQTHQFVSAVYAERGYVHFLGFENADDSRNAVLARMAISDLVAGGLGEEMRYWTRTPSGPSWSFSPENLVPLFSPSISETDIQFVPEWGLYFATTYDPAKPPISITVAPSLTGPWSTPAKIYDVPEHKTVSFPIWSYAARPHPELSTRTGELVISYVTTSTDGLDPLYTPEGLGIYAPRFIRAQFALKNPVPAELSLHE